MRKTNLTFDEALSRMAALCSVSEHCESEVRDKLHGVAMSDIDIQRIVDVLYDEGYLDTARYCGAFSRDRLRFNHWGRVKIQQALRQKGLPESDIQHALEELPEDEYNQILADLLMQKARSLHDEDDYARRGKLIRFALGRGFTMNELKIDEL